MATEETDATEVLERAVLDLAKKATDQKSASYALDYAAAANQLAEARAWIRTPNNAHGGFSKSD